MLLKIINWPQDSTVKLSSQLPVAIGRQSFYGVVILSLARI